MSGTIRADNPLRFSSTTRNKRRTLRFPLHTSRPVDGAGLRIGQRLTVYPRITMGKVSFHQCASFFRDLCYHTRGFGKRRRRAREKGKRLDQDVLTTPPAWEGDTSLDAGPDEQGDGTTATSGELQTQREDPAVHSSSESSDSSDGYSPGNSPETIPNATDVPWTSSPTISAQRTDATWGTSQPVISKPTGLVTPENEDLQPTRSGSSSSHLQPDSTQGDDLADAPPWASQISGGNNTLMSGEAPSSGLSLPSLITPFSLGNSSQTTLATHPSSARAPNPSIAASSSSSDVQSLNGAPALPTMGPADGVASTRTVRTVAGATVGGVGLVLLIVVAVFVYIRGGVMRGLSSNIRFPSLRSKRRFPPSQPFNESEENFFRRDTAQIRPFDLENASMSSGSHYSDDEENWEEIDMRDARNGNMEKDDGEWLESWRRGKERMMSTHRPVELQLNPKLPRPPISLDDRRVN
ncbi:hypothetical protein ACEPAH_1217 [Sanghuangporus vaninii]